METLYYKYKIVKTQNIDELYKNGGDDKYIIPIYESFSWTEKVLKIENDRNFINLINILEDTEIDEYLDFHYNNFEKKKKLFLIHAETLIENEAELLNSNKDKKGIVLEWIEEKKQKFNEPKQQIQNEKKQKLTLSEKCLLILLLQENNLFPKSNIYITDTQIFNFISGIFEKNDQDIKKAFDKARKIINKKIKQEQVRAKMENLKNIEEYTKYIENKEINKRIEELKKYLQSIY